MTFCQGNEFLEICGGSRVVRGGSGVSRITINNE